MMLYNTVDFPVMVTVGDKTYRMERDSELEVKLSSGDHFFKIYKLNPRTGEPLRKYKTDIYPSTGMELYRGKWVRTSKMTADDGFDSTVICYGATALLRMHRDTKLYIREVFDKQLFFRVSTERYFMQTFDLTIENGELTHRKDGCVDELARQKLLRSVYMEMGFSIFRNLFMIAAIAVLLYWLSSFGIEAVNALLTTDVKMAIGMILLPLLFIVCLVYDLVQFSKIKKMKELPILPAKEEYEYL